MLAMPNLAIHLGYHWPAGTREPAGTLPSLPSRGLSLATAGESHRRYGVLKTSRLSVLLCRTDTHSSCRDPLPGQRTRQGTRKAPSQFVFFSLRNGVIAPSGQVNIFGPLSVQYITKVLSVMPASSSALSTWPTFLSWSIITS